MVPSSTREVYVFVLLFGHQHLWPRLSSISSFQHFDIPAFSIQAFPLTADDDFHKTRNSITKKMKNIQKSIESSSREEAVSGVSNHQSSVSISTTFEHSGVQQSVQHPAFSIQQAPLSNRAPLSLFLLSAVLVFVICSLLFVSISKETLESQPSAILLPEERRYLRTTKIHQKKQKTRKEQNIKKHGQVLRISRDGIGM